MVKYYLGSDHGWDCGVNGFVLVDVKQAKQDWGLSDKEDIIADIKDTLGAFTDYANGDMFFITLYQLNDKGEKDEELDSAGSIRLECADGEELFDLGFLEGNLKDWQEAKENIQTSYTVAD